MTPAQRWSLFVAAALWLLLLPPLTDLLLARLNLWRTNFQGRKILAGYGLVILLWSAPLLAALMPLFPEDRFTLAAYLLILVGMGALGFADDLWGDRRVTGLRGHLRKALIEGEITTGFVKAVGGLALAVCVPRCVLARAWPDALLDGAVIALCANALNLLDLRPGRACAAFFLGALIVLGAQFARPRGSLWMPPLAFVFIPTLVVYERDARARAMLGDTGSNLLGGALGLALTLAFPALAVRAGLLTALLFLHLLAERHSLSALIQQNPLLRRLDALTGRR